MAANSMSWDMFKVGKLYAWQPKRHLGDNRQSFFFYDKVNGNMFQDGVKFEIKPNDVVCVLECITNKEVRKIVPPSECLFAFKALSPDGSIGWCRVYTINDWNLVTE
jgi:hypothetical protein